MDIEAPGMESEVTARVEEEATPFTPEQLQAEFDALPDESIECHPRMKKHAGVVKFFHADGTPADEDREREEALLFAWFTDLKSKYGFLLASLAAARAENATLRAELTAAQAGSARLAAEVARVSEQLVHLVGAGQRLNRAAMLFLIEQYHEEETDATISRYADAVLELGAAQSTWRAALAGRAETTNG